MISLHEFDPVVSAIRKIDNGESAIKSQIANRKSKIR
jgi:hypothetical protein